MAGAAATGVRRWRQQKVVGEAVHAARVVGKVVERVAAGATVVVPDAATVLVRPLIINSKLISTNRKWYFYFATPEGS